MRYNRHTETERQHTERDRETAQREKGHTTMKTMMMMMMITMMMMNNNTTTQHDTHMRAMVVTQLDYTQDIVTCVDAVGYEWEFYGCEDYAVNDLVCTLMDDNGTLDTILDDIIIDAEYTGYWME